MPDIVPRVQLSNLPTPIHRLNRVSEKYNVDLWIKRDDLTGFAMGGNKGRKLEFLIADVLSKGATTVITCGASQSNFIRQLAAACNMFSLKCIAMVMDTPYEVSPPLGFSLQPSLGNEWLAKLYGVEFLQLKNGTWNELFSAMDSKKKELENEGEIVYQIPIGGSSALGAYSFFLAGDELNGQLLDINAIVFASSSGSTQVGLSSYYHGANTKVIGIAVDPEPEIASDFATLSHQLNSLLPDIPAIPSTDIIVEFGYEGGGYGVYDDSVIDAIKEMNKMEGILLDPIYTGKAFKGLINLIENNKISGRIVFWHTGGIPNIFAMTNI